MILPGIQTLRGIAALLVVFYHGAILAAKPKYFAQEIFGGAFSAGFRGVDLFFVISGFIMMHTLVQKPDMRMSVFLTNRGLRIFIPYLPAFLALTFAYLLVPAVAQGGIELNLSYYIYNLFLLPRIDLTTYVPVVAWTLTHELMFYGLFAALIISRNKVGYAAFGVWMAVCFANFWGPNALSDDGYMILKPINLAFGFGILAQIASTRISERTAMVVTLGGALTFVLCLSFDTGLRNENVVLELAYFTSAALLCGGIGKLRCKPLEKVGDLSYSLYLIHYPIMAAAFIFLPRITGGYDANVYLFLAGLFIVVYVAALIYHLLFEKLIYKQIRARMATARS